VDIFPTAARMQHTSVMQCDTYSRAGADAQQKVSRFACGSTPNRSSCSAKCRAESRLSGGLLQAVMEDCDAIIWLASGEDLIWAWTLRGHQKACLKDAKVRFIADQQVFRTRSTVHLLMSITAEGLRKQLAVEHDAARGRLSYRSACTIIQRSLVQGAKLDMDVAVFMIQPARMRC